MIAGNRNADARLRLRRGFGLFWKSESSVLKSAYSGRGWQAPFFPTLGKTIKKTCWGTWLETMPGGTTRRERQGTLMTRSCLPGRADHPCHEDEQSATTQHPPGGEAIGLSRPGHQGRHCTSQPDSAAPDPEPDDFLIGAEAVRAFVAREWKRQLDCRLKKEVWTYSGDQVAILFEYEWHDAESGQWISTYGEEHWEIAPDGLMSRLSANGRDIVIDEANS